MSEAILEQEVAGDLGVSDTVASARVIMACAEGSSCTAAPATTTATFGRFSTSSSAPLSRDFF